MHHEAEGTPDGDETPRRHASRPAEEKAHERVNDVVLHALRGRPGTPFAEVARAQGGH